MTLSAQDNSTLLQNLKSGFKRKISWNEYLSKPELLRQKAQLNHFLESSFQRLNRLFILTFENDSQRTSHSSCYLQNVELKDYNIRSANNK